MTSPPPDPRPVILAGAARSGTSLLNSIVGSHPDVAMFQYDPALWRFYDENRAVWSRLPADRSLLPDVLDDLFRRKRVVQTDIPIDRAEVERDVAALARVSYGDILAAILGQQARAYGKPRWGHKGSHNDLCAADILAAWPGAKIVHIVRDGRDTLVSGRSRDWWPHTERYLIANWLPSARAALDNVARWPEACMLLRYEDLVADPEPVARRVCDFLALTFTPDMLDAAGQPGWRGHNSRIEDVAAQGISQSPVGRHITRLSAHDVAICNLLGGQMLRAHGYRLDTRPLSPLHYARAALHIALYVPLWRLRRVQVRLMAAGRA